MEKKKSSKNSRCSVPLSSAPAGTALAACATPILSISDESIVKGASAQEPPAAAAADDEAEALAEAAEAGAAAEGEAPPPAPPLPSALPAGTHSQSLMGRPATDARAAAAEAEDGDGEEPEPEPDDGSAAGSKMRPKGAVAASGGPSADGSASWTVAGVVPGPPGGEARAPTAYQPTRSSAGKVCLSAFFFF